MERMCGITGWVDWNRNLLKEMETIEKMANTLKKRGPDDFRIWADTHISFGHTRLAVVDLTGGKQPMKKEINHHLYIITYNGELYNTEEIRRELLKRGYQFQSTSDTEVLLTSYIEWKEDCLQYLNGIFTFAIWNKSKQKLFVARDRLGVKPLFYFVDAHSFMFGSEIKSLLAHPSIKPEIDREGLCEIFGLAPSRTPGNGIFKNLEELRPGHALKFTREGLKLWRYWNVKSEKHTDTVEDTAEKIKQLFIDSVKRQLVSDVPLSTFLSGGVDSSAITAIAAKTYIKEGRGTLKTFSIEYEGNDQYFESNEFLPSSDGPWIEKMVQTFSTDHYNKIISSKELVQLLKEAVEVRDQPGMADIDSSLLWFCREIKKETTVSLSGECADEIFGGYPWFHSPNLNNNIFPWMRSIEVRENLLNDSWKKKLNLKEYVQHRYKETIEETPYLEGENKEDKQRRELFYLNMVWFMSQLLERKDRMSMGAGLEVRVPFADHRLVEYVWNIPWEIKTFGNREKGILRKALEGILPNEILYRKKSPYPKTFHPAYTSAVSEWLSSILSDETSPILEVLNKEKIKHLVNNKNRLLKTPWFGQLMTGPQLIAHICQIDYWFRHYHVKMV